MLTREGILEAKDLPTKAVDVSEWWPTVGTVYVRTLSAIEAESLKGIDESGNFLGQFAALVMCDENGERLFSDEDADEVGTKNASALREICEAAQELNGMGAKTQEDAVKN